jgi:VIT1/CCC1 family predicted Fe2+/Mn2+ transporter
MTTDDDREVEELRRELEQIKDAMGLRERYPSQFRAWLIYGLLVPLAALASQAVVLYDLPGWVHPLAWAGFMGLGGVALWVQDGQAEAEDSGVGKPNVFAQWLSVFAYATAVIFVVSPLLPADDPVTAQATIFAILVGAVGAAYLLLSITLEAYFVEQFDRRVVAVGGLWMVLLAVAIVRLEPLQTWGYAVFGAAYFAYAMAAYLTLRRRAGPQRTGEPA